MSMENQLIRGYAHEPLVLTNFQADRKRWVVFTPNQSLFIYNHPGVWPIYFDTTSCEFGRE